MKKLVVVIFAVTALLTVGAAAKAKGAKSGINGWVSDVSCGAKGTNSAHADCAKKCADKGVALAIVTDKGHSVWKVENPDAVKGHEGHHVTVKGTTNKANKTINITEVAMMADQGTPDKSAKHDDMHKSDK